MHSNLYMCDMFFFAVQFFFVSWREASFVFCILIAQKFFFLSHFSSTQEINNSLFFRFLFLLFTHCLFFFVYIQHLMMILVQSNFDLFGTIYVKKKIVRFYRFGSILSFGLSHTYIHALLFHLFNVNLLSHTPTYTVYN